MHNYLPQTENILCGWQIISENDIHTFCAYSTLNRYLLMNYFKPRTRSPSEVVTSEPSETWRQY
jgi:hypothetical protein